MAPTALITGITGQDGSYLAELLLDKGYDVHGMVRRASTEKFERIEHIRDRITLHQGDLLDQRSLVDALRASAARRDLQPGRDELRRRVVDPAHAHGRVHRHGRDADARGDARRPAPRRASTRRRARRCSARCARSRRPRRRRSTRGRPTAWPRPTGTSSRSTTASPTTCTRRRGILFNHESQRRGLEFVTRKITWHAAAIKHGLLDKLALGNLDARRDWGYAKDYVEAMWSIAPAGRARATTSSPPTPDNSVRECVAIAFDEAGLSDWEQYVETDQSLVRPAEVDHLIGDYSKAERELGWKPRTSFEELIRLMTRSDLELLGR